MVYGVSGPATLSSNVVTITGTGTVTLTADQAGNSNYNAAQVSRSFTVNPYQQALTAFPAIPNHVYGDAPFSITLPSSGSPSGIPVVYGVSGPATLSSNVVTITGVGPVTLTANQAGNANYTAAQVITSFTVSQGSQTITFPAIGSLVLTTNLLILPTATSSSGLPVSYSVISGPSQLVGSNQLSFTGTGSVTIQANQAGDSNWLSASPVTQSFNVRQGSQSISFAPLGTNGYGTTPYQITNASASSGLPVTYTSSAPKVATIVSNTLTVMGLGTTTITSSQGGDSNWFAATPVSRTLVVGKGSQSISAFTTVPNPTYASNAIMTLPPPLPTASSGLPVTLSVKSGTAVMSGTNAVRITGGGAVVLAADQAGNANYLAAPQITTSFTVQKASQMIGALVSIPGKTNGAAPFTVTIPKASSGLPVALSVLSGPATVTNSTVTLTGAGTVVVAADQAGNGNYLPASTVTTSFAVAKGSQTITWAAPAKVTNRASSVQLAAKASSGLPVTYLSYAGNIRVTTNGLVTILGSGTASITASQPGDNNWNPATSLSRNLVVVLRATTTNSASNQIAGISPISSLATLPVCPTTFPLMRPALSGSVVAWGDNAYGETKLPKGLTNVVQLSSRGLHSLALRSDGTVAAWGWNASGQTNVPTSLTNVVQVAAGVSFSAALRTNGSVIAWGDNALGQTNIPSGLTNAVQISAGSHHGLALRSDGTVTGWGWNGYGQTAVPDDATNVVQVAAGYFHSAVLKGDGSVEAWGDDTYGETDIPLGLTNVVRIAAGLNHTVALKADGTVAAWGWNDQGQCDVPEGLSGVAQIATGGNTVYAVTTNGVLVTWGDNTYGQRNPPAGLSGVYQFVLGLYHALGLKR